MSREIKFRYVYKNGNNVKAQDYDIFDIEYSVPGDIDYYKERGFDLVDRLQHTGLKDKNGVEIYEGDIVNGGFDNCEVKYSTDRAQFVIDSFAGEVNLFKEKIDKCGVVVIGNIHQSPELIK